MSSTTQNSASFASPSIIGDASPSDYFALLKPRVMSLVIWTALAGVLCAPTPVHPVVGRRHRRADGAHAPAPGARWQDRAGRSARLRPDAGAARGADACRNDQ